MGSVEGGAVPTEISGPPADAAVTGRWIFDRIEGWARQEPQRCAFVLDHADRADRYSYADVVSLTDRIAAGLEARGLRRGDRVGILMENVPHWVFALLGILRMGGVVVPLATALPETALKNVAQHAGCRLVFTDAQNEEKARSLAPEVVVLPCEKFVNESPAPSPYRSPDDRETALIVYTSGTTGDPKGVQLTALGLGHEIRGVAESMALSADHRILSVLPFSHVLPLVANGLGALCIGASVTFLSSISPQRIVEAFHKHRITFFVCVPQFFYALHKRIFSQVGAQSPAVRTIFGLLFRLAGKLPRPDQRRKLFGKIHRTIGPDLRLLASGGSRFDPAVAEDLSRLGYTMLQAYGLTETSAAATVTPAGANAIGTVGKPIRGASIRIDSPDSKGVGEVCIRGPIVMKGYYQKEDLAPNSWFHSGDLGFLRPDGNLVITGRSKDVIVLANGENVYPEETETHYAQSPWVEELCVMGIAERLHAVVVPNMEEFRRQGQTTITHRIRVDLENLSKQLPSYYRILSFSIQQEPLPRTVTRKLRRFEIQRQYLESQARDVRRASAVEHPRFLEGAGAVVSRLVHQARPDSGPLDVSMNLELDLGFDSLARVELFGHAEEQLGVRLAEDRGGRIYTLGDLIDALVDASLESGRGRSWTEILEVPPADSIHQEPALNPGALTRWSSYVVIKIAKVFFRTFLGFRYSGLEKLPQQTPFILCPNHQSFLDGFFLISALPRNIIDRIFVLGVPQYWQGAVMRFLARLSRIVEIDTTGNLMQAMRIGALGLRKNRVLLIFPEGVRTIDGRVAEFKNGAAILACEVGAPIVPIGIKGAFEMWPRGGRFHLHAVEIAIGDPIDPRSFANSPDPYTALSEAVRNAVVNLAR